MGGGKGGGGEMEVNEYHMSMHIGICKGPVDAITRARYGEKTYWSGYASQNTDFYVNAGNLFGGPKKEGGVGGWMRFLLGGATQLLPDYFAKKLGREGALDAPGFRGVTTVIHDGAINGHAGWMWSSNVPYLKNIDYTVIAIPKTLSASLGSIGSMESGHVMLAIEIDSSGSMDSRRQQAVKTAMALLLNNLAVSVSDIARIDIQVSRFDGLYRRYNKATPADFTALAEWINGWAFSSGTDFTTAIRPAVDWFTATAGDTAVNKRVNIFITDGEPDPVSTAAAARTLAMPLLDGTIPVEMYGVNVELTDTTYTAYLDNTASDGVPVVTADDPSGLLSIMMTAVFNSVDANPASIIYEVHVNPEYGMGTDPAETINYESFLSAAQTLRNEGLGLSLAWAHTTPVKEFVDDILNHINGVVYPDPKTGKTTLKLIRDDYDRNALRTITPNNAKMTAFSRKAWGEMINEVVVTWTDPLTEQENTVTLQDNGSIAEQGEVISDTKNYYGVRTSALAWKLAARDLRVATAPLANMEVELNREFWDIVPGECVRMTWPEYGIENLVMRVWDVHYGKRKNSRIRVSLTEDIFTLPSQAFLRPPTTEWVNPAVPPRPISMVRVITMPAMWAAKVANISISQAPEGAEFAGILAAAPNTDTSHIELLGQSANTIGQIVWEDRGTRSPTAYALSRDAMVAEVISTGVRVRAPVAYSTAPGQFVVIGIGNEFNMEIAVVEGGSDTAGWTLRRGVLDTVPQNWPVDTPMWFLDQDLMIADYVQQSANSQPKYKLLSITSVGRLAEGAAPEVTGSLSDRLWAPLRPANCKVGGVLGLQPVDMQGQATAVVTWAERNRITEEKVVFRWDDPSVAPEDGQQTKIVIRDASGSFLAQHLIPFGQTSFNVDLTSLSVGGAATLELWSVRGDYESLQCAKIRLINLPVGVSVVMPENEPYTPPANNAVNVQI